ncbi:PEGA domain-containing protein [bacterium]|nr:PEGA domain-containing protein [bacterium]
MNPARRAVLAILLACFALTTTGCVQRSLLVKSNPPGARVFLDGREKGVTPVEFDFKWYGGHKLSLEKEGYATHTETLHLSAPVHHQFPIDLVTASLPVKSRDRHTVEVNLEPEARAEAR